MWTLYQQNHIPNIVFQNVKELVICIVVTSLSGFQLKSVKILLKTHIFSLKAAYNNKQNLENRLFPNKILSYIFVTRVGLEPTTPTLKVWCATNCANESSRWSRWGLNPRPTDYESVALTNCATRPFLCCPTRIWTPTRRTKICCATITP